MPDRRRINPHVCVAYVPSRERGPFFLPDECDAVIRWAEENGLAPVRVSGKGNGTIRRHRQLDITTETVASGNGDIGWFTTRLENLVRRLNREIWRFALTGMAPVGIVKYEPGDHVSIHADLAAQYPDRKIVALVQLSPSSAYAGGSLRYGVAAPMAAAARNQGAVLVFPAWTPHRVTPVRSGIRYSAVCLGLGPSFR